jgi:hypothetical protein
VGSQASVRSSRKITFPDGSSVGIIGLDAVMEDLCHRGKPVNGETAAEMMEALDNYNYIPSSQRHIYKHLVLEEYRRYLESQ